MSLALFASQKNSFSDLELSLTTKLKLEDVESFQDKCFNKTYNELLQEMQELQQEIVIKQQQYQNAFSARRLAFEEKSAEIESITYQQILHYNQILEDARVKNCDLHQMIRQEKYKKMQELSELGKENAEIKNSIMEVSQRILEFDEAYKSKVESEIKPVKEEIQLLEQKMDQDVKNKYIEAIENKKAINSKLQLQKDIISKLLSDIKKIEVEISVKKNEFHEKINFKSQEIKEMNMNNEALGNKIFEIDRKRRLYETKSVAILKEKKKVKEKLKIAKHKTKENRRLYERLNILVYKSKLP